MTRYEPAIDVDRLVAIDVHVHIEHGEHGENSLPADLADAAAAYFKNGGLQPDLDSVAAYYRERDMAAVVFTVDATTNLGHAPISSAEIAAGAQRNNDVLIPFGSVDPLQGRAAVDLARRLIEDHGVRGFKFHPTVQGFDPSDSRFSPLFEVLQEAGAVALFHTGQTRIGAGMRGGRGLRLGLSNPMLLDGVAADFGDLQIIMAHPSVPWQAEAISVATHKHNTWIDLSGWSPKYFPEELVRAAGSFLKDRVLFGSDYPMLSPDRWMRDIEQTALKPEALPGIVKDNAVRLLGLGAGA
ncbi:amidohydrolase family protein [Leucobacter ruminantium]|uniref:Amidohydrolase n=1 Tax=Leucobacter ruminantium TaxID=1289170 RepID=A0A939LXP9_9MICO|nr:amidohydrolase family protein [Leucobacter ruminantium]MBO1806605.1 amidohydrolase [Leucobacter ruminantium]